VAKAEAKEELLARDMVVGLQKVDDLDVIYIPSTNIQPPKKREKPLDILKRQRAQIKRYVIYITPTTVRYRPSPFGPPVLDKQSARPGNTALN
jgi:hypothetical protein